MFVVVGNAGSCKATGRLLGCGVEEGRRRRGQADETGDGKRWAAMLGEEPSKTE